MINVSSGQTDTYICPLPLDDCLDRLQNCQIPSSIGIGFISSKIAVKIICKDQNLYVFSINDSNLRNKMQLTGQLKSIDPFHTEITIDRRLNDMGMQIVLTILVSIYILSTSHNQSITMLIICWYFVSTIFALAGEAQMKRQWQKSRNLLIATLPLI